MKFGTCLLAACTFSICTSASLSASTDVPQIKIAAFAYRISHPVTPLPDSVFEQIADLEAEADAAFDDDPPSEVKIVKAAVLSREGMCGTVALVAQAYDLPVPFFANLIWSESSFETGSVSRAGAQGIAQFMPRTAAMFGLDNPFEPIHALNVAGKFLYDLRQQFGNLGLAAAAYNAGPGRVSAWTSRRGSLPRETRRYVLKITGRPAEHWLQKDAKLDPEFALMPAKAPCTEVAEAVEEQERLVRIHRLMAEIVAAAASASNGGASAEGEDGSDRVEVKPVPKPNRKTERVRLAKDLRGAAGKEVAVSARSVARKSDKSDKSNKSDTKKAVNPKAEEGSTPPVKSASKPDASKAKSAEKPSVEPAAMGASAATRKSGDKPAEEPAAKAAESSSHPDMEAAPPQRRVRVVRRVRVAVPDRHTVTASY